MRRKLRFRIAEGGFALAIAADEAEVGATEQIRKGQAFSNAINLHEDSAAFEGELVGLALLEGRSWRSRCDGEQRCDRAVSGCEDGWNHRAGHHRAARNRAGRK